MTPEAKVKKKVIAQLKLMGAYYFYPVTGGYGRSGGFSAPKRQAKRCNEQLSIEGITTLSLYSGTFHSLSPSLLTTKNC